MTSANGTILIARKTEQERLRAFVREAQSGTRGILCLSAESGYGKTVLLEQLVQETRSSRSVDAVRVECQAPIGVLNVSSIQPMQPWMKALEQLMELKAGSAKKRLAMNIGLSVLGLIPIAGSIFDMTKEVMRDLREYRADKKNAQDASSAGSKLMHEFYEALNNIAEQQPFCIILDDAQWMDAQSVEFLEYLIQKTEQRRFGIVLSYQQATVTVKNPAFAAWLEQHSRDSALQLMELQAFSAEDVHAAVASVFAKQARNQAFEDWLMRRSAGIPVTVMEYLQYFGKNTPFREDGSLDSERLNSQAVPASLQALFSRSIEQLSEDDVNLLALCSAEGRECSVFVVAQLLNLDTLSTIKKLKSIQYRTGMVRSTGAHARYGVRSTLYEFTQALHHSYFHATLEMEERVELHERIASILQRCFREAQDEQLQRQLAPYIAAHALEAGDEETARTMLVQSAQQAEDSGSAGIVADIINTMSDLPLTESASEDEEIHRIAQHMGLEEAPAALGVVPPQPESAQTDIPDCNIVREDVLTMYFDGDFAGAAKRALDFLELSGQFIATQDHQVLSAMAARADIEAGLIDRAAHTISGVEQSLQQHPDMYAQCIVDNVRSVLMLRRGDLHTCLSDLRRAATVASGLSDDLKLLTISNISLALRQSNARQSKVFERIARQLGSSLHFFGFADSAFQSAQL